LINNTFFTYITLLFIIIGSPKKIVQRRAVSMPGLERETEILEASKRNSSQTTVDSGFPATPLNNEGIATSDVGNINTSTSVVTTQEANKGNNVNYNTFF
jgi:hypothetical protein